MEWVVRLPAAVGELNVEVEKMEDDHATFWHTYVQPRIDQLDEVRADKGWDWAKYHKLTTLTKALRQRPEGYRLTTPVVTQEGVKPLPIGMILLVRRYYWPFGPPIVRSFKKAVFVWFLSAANNAFADLAIPLPKLQGKAVLDIAVTLALQFTEGRLWLHADPKGGDQLAQWYSSCGMLEVPAYLRLRRPRTNDGRYFYFDANTAGSFSKKLDAFR